MTEIDKHPSLLRYRMNFRLIVNFSLLHTSLIFAIMVGAYPQSEAPKELHSGRLQSCPAEVTEIDKHPSLL
jgi:hypothetical protein